MHPALKQSAFLGKNHRFASVVTVATRTLTVYQKQFWMKKLPVVKPRKIGPYRAIPGPSRISDFTVE
jgi:hypothetical protein